MTKYKFLFHIHTFQSYDATITYNQLYKTLIKYKITHIAITEHNNLNSYSEFSSFLKSKNCDVIVIPSIEYTTKVGDIIAMNISEEIEFDDYLDLVKKIKDKNGYIILPHPYKRKKYPTKLYKYLDFYEVLNMRGIGKSFDSSTFANIKIIYGSDAHNFMELPGAINTFYSELDFFNALETSIIIPEIITTTLTYNQTLSKIISKVKKKFFK